MEGGDNWETDVYTGLQMGDIKHRNRQARTPVFTVSQHLFSLVYLHSLSLTAILCLLLFVLADFFPSNWLCPSCFQHSKSDKNQLLLYFLASSPSMHLRPLPRPLLLPFALQDLSLPSPRPPPAQPPMNDPRGGRRNEWIDEEISKWQGAGRGREAAWWVGDFNDVCPLVIHAANYLTSP